MIYIQSMGEGNSQDADDNRSDIQYRVRYIAEFYHEAIQCRLEELSGERPFVGWDVDSILKDRAIRTPLNEVLTL